VLLTTFLFEATSEGTAVVDIPEMHPSGTETVVFDGAIPNFDITGTLTGATIEIVPDGALCRADLDMNGVVDVFDLLELLAAWGMCGKGCVGDLDDDGLVNVFDLLELLSAWGPCP